MDTYCIAVNTDECKGILLGRKDDRIVVATTLKEALDVIDYRGGISDILHNMQYKPVVLKLKGDTEKAAMDHLLEIVKNENGRSSILTLSCSAGRLRVVRLKDDVDMESLIVAKFSALGSGSALVID